MIIGSSLGALAITKPFNIVFLHEHPDMQHNRDTLLVHVSEATTYLSLYAHDLSFVEYEFGPYVILV